MRVQNHIPIKAVAIREENGLEIGTEYDVEDIMMGQSNTSVELVGIKGAYEVYCVGLVFSIEDLK